jgi:2-haloacid dehalogenase
MNRPLALFFDMFGTVVDWRGSIGRAMHARFGEGVDGEAFADAWRAEYQPAMQRVRSGGRGFVKLDLLHRENLDRILPRFGLDHLGEAERAELTLLWHRLDAWPEAGLALRRLGVKYLLAPMSNGNIALMVGMARHNHFHWDAILGAEIARDYKPKAGVYLAGCAALDLAPGQCMMVAAHSDDLVAARAAGLMTAHVARPDEFGPGKGEAAPSAPVDVAARDLDHLAEVLGC